MTLYQILFFLPAAALVAASPGANNLLAFTNGARAGLRAAAFALAGRGLAFVLMIGMVIFGLGALLEASELAFQIVKWVGVVYLAWLGIQMLRDRGDTPKSAELGPPSALARREFVVAMTNPKAVLLFTAFVPQFIVSGPNAAAFTVQLVILGGLYIAIEFVAALVWALAGAMLKSLGPSARRMLLVNRISGGLMLGAAGVLATTQRN